VNVHTKCEDVDELIVKLVIVFTDLCEGGVYCILELMISGRVALLLPCSLKFFECRYGTPEGRLMFVRKDLLDSVCIGYNGPRVVDTIPVACLETKGGPG
jgi:hypothetical protein